MNTLATLSTLALVVGCSTPKDDQVDQGFTPRAARGGCAGALLVSESDFTSTNISVLAPDGSPLSDSFISSKSAPPGLSTALSGDVVFPSAAPRSGKVVLIDRFPNSVITFVDPETAQVERQVAVRTGFASNPHDYLELSADVAFVTRYEGNPRPGTEDFDAGSDVLVLNPQTGELTESISLTTPDDGEYLPRPDRMVRVGQEVWVLLGGLSKDFKKAREARIVSVSVDDHSIGWTLSLDGVSNCGGLALSPDRTKLVLSCSGVLGAEVRATPESAVVLLDTSERPPKPLQRFDVSQQLEAPLGSSIAFVTPTLVLGTAFGDGMARSDVAYTLDLASGSTSVLLDAGASFALGDLYCAPGCKNAYCYITDAQHRAIDTWAIGAGGKLSPMPGISTGLSVGLPPRSLGTL